MNHTAAAEVLIPPDRILRHVLRSPEQLNQAMTLRVYPANFEPPTFRDRFYLANIGSDDEPLLLDLRFAETDRGFWIALLMTNERYPRDLTVMASEISRRLRERRIE